MFAVKMLSNVCYLQKTSEEKPSDNLAVAVITNNFICCLLIILKTFGQVDSLVD